MRNEGTDRCIKHNDTIIAIVGESGSGKTTLCNALEEKGINVIESYTTRKRRYEGERGHIFVNKAPDNLDNVIALTTFDGNFYYATREQYKGLGNSVYTLDPKGVDSLLENVNDANILIIYLNVSESTRMVRMLRREVKSYRKDTKDGMIDTESKEYKKVMQRLDHDREAFKIVKADYILNEHLTVQDNVKIILEILNIK